MRVAVLGDIHGNLSALEAVLSDLRSQSPDLTICLGDIAMGGPQPQECIQSLAALNCPTVRGNADRQMLEAPRAFRSRGFTGEREMHGIDLWSQAQLSVEDRLLLGGYSSTVQGPDLLCFHGSPRRDDEVLDGTTSVETLSVLRAEAGSQAMWIGGHTHLPLLRTLGGWQLVNPGSVGLPFETRAGTTVNVARAEYCLLDGRHGGWEVQFRRVPYPVALVHSAIRHSTMPYAQWLIQEWVEV